MSNNIILIGPIGAGKTTIGELLSQRLNRQWVQIDGVRFDYYKEIGYDEGLAQEKRQSGIAALIAYWKPFEVYAVERILADHQNCVIDFGAGHSVYEDETLLARARQALAPYPHVILLLPSPDPAESLAILTERLRAEDPELSPDIIQVNELFLRHRSNYDLAKHIVYTKGKLPQETCDEIATWLGQSSSDPSRL
jgi:shikimate kinase